ncbi:hypothetical protein AB4212_00585 [Streptomyces sp. 2MCAF27]
MSSSSVVVLGVMVEDSTQVSFTGDEESVSALCAGCAYPPFGERVGPGALRRRPDNGCAVAGEDGVERGSELAVPVTDEVPEAPSPLLKVREQIAGKLGDPYAGRMGGDTQDVNAPRGDLHDEEDIETSEKDGLHMHEIASQQRVGL